MNRPFDTPSCDSTSQVTPSVCDHHPSASQPIADMTSPNDDQYPPLPPLRIGATSVSCVVCDTFNENIRRASLSIDGEQPTTPQLPTSHPDWNVRKWQTRQIAKAFMDNTINSVLDEMGFTPVPESAPDSDPDDVLGSINFPHVDSSEEEEEEDESVENEGILSAIQKHGLQRHTLQSLSEVTNRFRYTSSPSIRHSPPPPRRWGPNQQHVYQISDLTDRSVIGSDSVFVRSDLRGFADDVLVSLQDLEANRTDPTSDSTRHDEVNWHSCASSSAYRCTHVSSSHDSSVAQTNAIDSACFNVNDPLATPSNSIGREGNFSRRPDFTRGTCSSSHDCPDQENEVYKKRQGRQMISSSICKRRCVEPLDEDSNSSSSSASPSHTSTIAALDSGVMSITSHSSNRSSPTFGHFEFMDAAVAAAIQKKGLSALACQDL